MENAVKRSSGRSDRAMRWSRTCVSCNAEMDSNVWAGLPLVSVLNREDLQRHLSVPVGWDVEVRRCACGALIASFGRPMKDA